MRLGRSNVGRIADVSTEGERAVRVLVRAGASLVQRLRIHDRVRPAAIGRRHEFVNIDDRHCRPCYQGLSGWPSLIAATLRWMPAAGEPRKRKIHTDLPEPRRRILLKLCYPDTKTGRRSLKKIRTLVSTGYFVEVIGFTFADHSHECRCSTGT